MFLLAPNKHDRILCCKEVKKGEAMQLTRISPKRQITILKEVFEKLRLEVGDFLEVEATGEGLLLTPKKLISKDQSWFWSQEWQEKERAADEAITKGELSEPFSESAELIRHLRKRR
jgi:AbrB family looped-hinge helix DNA binding protein